MTPTDGLPPAERRRAMTTLSIAICISVLATAIANIALPAIAYDLDVSPAMSVWVVNAYQLAVTVSLLPLSSLGDIYGYRRVYLFGLVVFCFGSLACGLAGTLPLLVAGRVLQGLGAAGIMSVNTALVRYIYPRHQLGRGVGMTALIVATSSAAGPSLAAGILAVASWQWLFIFNVPLGILALALALRSLPATPRSGHSFDLSSALLNAASFGLVFVGIDGLGHGRGMALSLALLAVGIVVGTYLAVCFAESDQFFWYHGIVEGVATTAAGTVCTIYFLRDGDKCKFRLLESMYGTTTTHGTGGVLWGWKESSRSQYER